ncbi:TPA: hypothetical protein NKV81_004482 [Vibrio parahaemolyticus]|nr:hypothetical protein [Vibrio parahaemolyticus]HAS6505795.1 hypothetical protein [Vibrio parahaemolyticus]HCH4229662.1 hypothetical protein [Vibrio parahaemolyticus]HCH5506013.1 hypothetical protein [Vibrio parahaemolyticus]
MALESSALEQLIVTKLNAAGFKTDGKHAHAKVMANAIAEAVVEHITGNAEVPVTGGSSAGTYKVT